MKPINPFYLRLIQITLNYKYLNHLIERDIQDYDYFANKYTTGSWLYWLIGDIPKYLYRSIGNFGNLTLREGLKRLQDYQSEELSDKIETYDNLIKGIKESVKILNNINIDSEELTDEETSVNRKLTLAKNIIRNYDKIFKKLQLSDAMNLSFTTDE